MGLTADAGVTALAWAIVLVPLVLACLVVWTVTFRLRTIARNVGKAGDLMAHAFHCDGPEYGHCNSDICHYPPFD